MKAVRYYGREDIRVENVAEPKGFGPKQLKVRPLTCGICGTDLHEFAAGPIVTPKDTHKFTGAKLPQILGHEFSAEVLETGADIRHVRPGDRISIQPLIMPLDDYYSRRGMNHLSPSMACVGLSWDWGGMGETAVINDYNAVHIPDGVTDEQGAMVEPAAVALYGVDRARIPPGGTVLITGAGPIGALTVLAASAAGAGKIFVSEPNPNRRRQIEAFGVTEAVLDPTKDDVLQIIRDATEDGVGVDSAIEAVGNEAALNLCIDAVRGRGTVVQLGLHVKRATVDAALIAYKDISLEGIWCYPITIWPRVISLIESGKMPVEKIVTARIGADDVVDKGFRTLLDPSGKQMKILVKVGE
jgi:(R,R)-butanediol dehydrogenase/meso-butanediol dehydrogenase/diacetyl reductase